MLYDTGTIIILDIGKNSASGDKQDSFFETARKCALRIIERNIIIQGKPLIGVILMGAKKSRNALAEECPGAFKYIELHAELNKPSWQMMRELPQETSERQGDWFEALIVAAHHYKTSSLKITGAKKIVLMTNFAAPARIGNNFNEVVEGFKTEEFEVFVIGPNIEETESKDVDLIKDLIYKTNGETATFAEAMSSWLFHKHKATKKSRGTAYQMSIGPHIIIPVTAHIKIKDEPVMKEAWQKTTDATSYCRPTRAVVVDKKIINPEDQMEVKSENTVTSYMFGQKLIPFNLPKENLYNNKLLFNKRTSLVIYGFTKGENIQWQCLNGDATHYVTGKKGDKRAQDFIICLVHCMQELGLVAIARQQYFNFGAPKMVALIPVVDNNGVCLSCIKLCYKEEIKNMAFPSVELKKYACNNEQVNAFKELIKAMDLTKAYDDSFNDEEAFPIGETVSPSLQYTLDCVAYRAMNPDKPLPQPRDEIMTLFKVPPLVEKRSREPLEALKKLFVLKKVEKPVSSRKRAHQQLISDFDSPGTSNQNGDMDMPKVKLPALPKKEEDVEHVGTLKPSSDFISLLSKGKSLAELAPEMTDVIESLVYTNIVGDRTKVLEAMKTYRDECVKNGPAHYNDWLKNFKRNLLERKRDVIISIINENQLNFILSSENNLSTYTEDNTNDDSQMYDNDTIPNSTELSIRTDVNDLFDEM